MKTLSMFLRIFILFLMILPHSTLANTIQNYGWSKPLNISNSPVNSSSPSITSDLSGVVHLVWVENVPEQNYIQYTSFKDGEWDSSIDIVTAQSGIQIRDTSFQCDTRGYLHLVYLGNGIQYTQAYSPLAHSARYWKAPLIIIPPVNNLSSPDLDVGLDDQLHLVYAVSTGPGSGIFYTNSEDNGKTWGQVQVVYENLSSDRSVSNSKISVDQKGKIHVVWVESNFPETYPPNGIRYSSSADGAFWSEADSLGEGPYGNPEVLAVSNQTVHSVWSGTLHDRYKFHRQSNNDGKSWASLWRDENIGGFQGSQSILKDSAGLLYWLGVGRYI